jgi:hypothetical protein
MHKLLQVTSRVLAFSLPIALVGSFAAPANAFVSSFEDGPETPLQDILDARISPNYHVVHDQDNTEWFTVDGFNEAGATLVLELAGFSNINSFGIYNDAGTEAIVFNGGDTVGQTMNLDFSEGNDLEIYAKGSSVVDTYADFGENFGFFLESGNEDTYFSQSFKNTNSKDMMASYRGDGISKIDPLNNGESGTFGNDDFVLAWEDVINGDNDYNDMVVMVTDVEPVPEPFTVLGSFTALGVGGFLKRKYGKKA